MKKGILAIYDKDTEYTNSLMKYLSHKKEFVFDVRVFTKPEVLEGVSKKQKIAILLVGEDMDVGQVEALAGQVMILCSGRLVQEYENYDMIYKYQSVEELIKEILEHYMLKEEQKNQYTYMPGKKMCQFISVFSPCGGKGVTTFSFGLGQILSKKQKVLYINLELFPSNFPVLSKECSSGLSELIYYIKQKKSNFYIKLATLIHHFHNLDYILPTGHYSDLYQIEKEDMVTLLSELRQRSDYEIVIFDIGYINEAIITLLENCNKIYIPKSQCGIEKEKENKFFEFLKSIEKENIMGTVATIDIPFDENLDKGIDILELSCEGVLGAFLNSLVYNKPY